MRYRNTVTAFPKDVPLLQINNVVKYNLQQRSNHLTIQTGSSEQESATLTFKIDSGVGPFKGDFSHTIEKKSMLLPRLSAKKVLLCCIFYRNQSRECLI